MAPRTLTLRLNPQQAAALDELKSATGHSDPMRAILAAVRAGRRARQQAAERLETVQAQAAQLRQVNARLEQTLADLERAQSQIRMRDKLAALGRLTAGVAHEIRNPLNFIQNFAEGSAELLEDLTEQLAAPGPDGALDAEQREDVAETINDLLGNVAIILSHTQRADRVIGDMLALGRDGGEMQPTAINDLFDHHARLACQSARAMDPDFDIEVVTDYDGAVDEIEVVPQDIARAFLNLVTNACHAVNEKRKRPPSAGWRPMLTLVTRRHGTRMHATIRDNGTGIPADIVDKVFDPFFTTKPPDQGSGLGLTLSSDLVVKHGGAIRINSHAPHFTEVTVELPLKPEPAPP
ncbi:MAG: two-component sensor histidine kinase [Gammaproteobacteria bacterium]|nr:two-component sensor histidine kinase [Gammaproteobacteria bacterium]